MTYSKIGWRRFAPFILMLALTAASCAPLEAIGLVQPKPNIIFILTDDMDNYLLPYMPITNRLIADEGALFTNYFTPTPLCCPSRSSTLRGQYAHNTNILDNTPGFRNFYRNTREQDTIATWLQDAGYETSLLGKYLNGYPVTAGNKYVPPGWTDWHVFFHHDVNDDDGGYYYHYRMNENGVIFDYEYDPEDYSTDVLAKLSIDFIKQSIDDGAPFFLYLSPTTPHGPSVPAPRHEGQLDEIEYPRIPSFLTEDATPKPDVVMNYATVPGEEFEAYDADGFFRLRAASLLSVDELVQQIYLTLEAAGELDNTYIIFTSDNGFHLGEHNFSGGKGLPYTEDIKVPFLIRGPGIAPGTTVTELTANIDLAPTFADMAGVKPADFVDGRSLLPLVHTDAEATVWRGALLTESGYKSRENKNLYYRGIRTENFLYVEFEGGAIEYYDLLKDPYERNNIYSQLDDETKSMLKVWLVDLEKCNADSCREIENSITSITP